MIDWNIFNKDFLQEVQMFACSDEFEAMAANSSLIPPPGECLLSTQWDTAIKQCKKVVLGDLNFNLSGIRL
jgi:hypothetical protein